LLFFQGIAIFSWASAALLGVKQDKQSTCDVAATTSCFCGDIPPLFLDASDQFFCQWQ